MRRPARDRARIASPIAIVAAIALAAQAGQRWLPSRLDGSVRPAVRDPDVSRDAR